MLLVAGAIATAALVVAGSPAPAPAPGAALADDDGCIWLEIELDNGEWVGPYCFPPGEEEDRTAYDSVVV